MTAFDAHTSLSIEYSGYVHFAYNVGKYLMQRCHGEMCNEKTILKWYLEQFSSVFKSHLLHHNKAKIIFEALFNNLIHDECLLVVGEEGGKRIVKKHPEFIVWAWRNTAKTFESGYRRG